MGENFVAEWGSLGHGPHQEKENDQFKKKKKTISIPKSPGIGP